MGLDTERCDGAGPPQSRPQIRCLLLGPFPARVAARENRRSHAPPLHRTQRRNKLPLDLRSAARSNGTITSTKICTTISATASTKSTPASSARTAKETIRSPSPIGSTWATATKATGVTTNTRSKPTAKRWRKSTATSRSSARPGECPPTRSMNFAPRGNCRKNPSNPRPTLSPRRTNAASGSTSSPGTTKRSSTSPSNPSKPRSSISPPQKSASNPAAAPAA